MRKTILVLGGGIGGITTARELGRKTGNEDGVILARILVFEKEEKNVFAPSLTWLMVGKRTPEEVWRDTKKMELEGIEVIFGEVETVDPDTVSVTVKGETYRGDYMVVSLGAEQSSEFKLHDAGHNFYTLEGAAAFHDELKNFRGGNIAVVVSSLPFKSPVAPYEAAMLVESYVREKGLRDKTRITLYTPESEPMGFAGKEISDNVKQLMQSKGVVYLPEHQLVSAAGKTLTFRLNRNETVAADVDLLAYTPKHLCPAVVRDSGLAGESGWIEADRRTLETKFPNVYAIGDITTIPLGSGEALPKAGAFAQVQAETVAHNIARDIAGKSSNKTFEGRGRYILELGDDKAKKFDGDFYAPDVHSKTPGVIRHWEKVLSEKSWFIRNF